MVIRTLWSEVPKHKVNTFILLYGLQIRTRLCINTFARIAFNAQLFICKSLRSSVFRVCGNTPQSLVFSLFIWTELCPFINPHVLGLFYTTATSWLFPYKKRIYVCVWSPYFILWEQTLKDWWMLIPHDSHLCIAKSSFDLLLIFLNTKVKGLEQPSYTWGETLYQSLLYLRAFRRLYSFLLLSFLWNLSHLCPRSFGCLISLLYTDFYEEYWLLF